MAETQLSDRHVGFTGTRRGMTMAQQVAVEGILWDSYGWLHHGDCLGADAQAHSIARGVSRKVKAHPPSSARMRAFCAADVTAEPKPYHERNHDIVDESEALIAAPPGMQEELRSGTWATVRYARRKGKPVTVVFPDGSLVTLTCWEKALAKMEDL